MYYQQYNVYKPGWYTGSAFPPQTGTGLAAGNHATSPTNLQTSAYVSCMHEEQSAWGQIFQTPSPPHHHHHHHHHNNGTAGTPTILQTAGPPPPTAELWEDAAVLAAAAVAAQNNSPTSQHQHQQQQSSQQQQHTSPNCNPQIVDHHVRAQPPRSPFEWMKKPSYHSQPNPGKTRTKDKYRVVYTDHQRLELEKEFHYSRYITIRRKAELATLLGLSERQVKIWFQNRRAKERKQVKKREELIHKEKMQQLAML